MKRLLALMMAIFLLCGLVFPGISTPLKADVTSNESKVINISVDPRIELISVVQLLSEYPLLTKVNSQYKKDVLNYFSPYKSLPAVQKFKEMSDNLNEGGFNYDAPLAAMLYLSDPPELKNILPFSNYDDLIDRAGGEENLEAFVEDLRDFAVKSDFMSFFNANKDYYSTLVNNVETNLGDYKYKDPGMLEDFYGISKNNYNIIIATLYPNGGYGMQIETEPSKYDVYAIIGPFFSEDTLRLIAWFELSHSFINPITEQYKDEVDKYYKLYLPIIGNDVSGSQLYLYWEWYIDETIARAVVDKFDEELIEQESGKEVAEKLLSGTLFYNDIKQGYIYVKGIYNLLVTYEQNRDKYPTFADFYPVILNYFSELSKLPFLPMDFQGSQQNQSNEVILTWRDTSDNEQGFKVYRESGSEEGFKLIVTLKENTTSYDDTTTEYGKTYTYRVASFNDNGKNFAPEDVTVTLSGSTNKTVVVLQIGKSNYTINGTPNTLDSPPIIENSVVLLPIRAVVEALGGIVYWDPTDRQVTILLGNTTVDLWIGNNTATVNGMTNLIDPSNSKIVPEIINNRTMLPLTFVSNSLGATIEWNETTQTITITYQAPQE